MNYGILVLYAGDEFAVSCYYDYIGWVEGTEGDQLHIRLPYQYVNEE